MADSNSPKTVLVVENEILVRMAIAGYLRECGYRVLEVSNGSEAKTVLAADTPVDLVFAEVDLPGDVGGFALARWIRQERPGVEIILTSGNAAMARLAADACDRDSFLGKPYSHEQLIRLIRQLLNR